MQMSRRVLVHSLVVSILLGVCSANFAAKEPGQPGSRKLINTRRTTVAYTAPVVTNAIASCEAVYNKAKEYITKTSAADMQDAGTKLMQGWGAVQAGTTKGFYNDLYRGSATPAEKYGRKAYWAYNIYREYPDKMKSNYIDYSKAVLTKDSSDPLKYTITFGANKMNRMTIRKIGANIHKQFGNHIASVFSNALPGFAPHGTTWTAEFGVDNVIFDTAWTEPTDTTTYPKTGNSGYYDITINLKSDLNALKQFCEKKAWWHHDVKPGAQGPQGGSTIQGQASGDNFGYRMAMNGAGDRVISGGPYNDGDTPGSNCGSARVFEYKNNAWSQLGDTFLGLEKNEQAGWALDINTVGDHVIFGAPYADNNDGYFKVYELNGASWQQKGQQLKGKKDSSEQFSFATSISGDGTTVAGGTPEKGEVRVYKWASTTWTQLGADITGDKVARFGQAIALSGDGTRIVIAAPQAQMTSGGTTHASVGLIRVYKYDGGNWVQLGQDVYGIGDAQGQFGTSVSFSEDGTRIHGSAPYSSKNDDDMKFSGSASVYELNRNSWTQVGDHIYGIAKEGYCGTGSKMSRDGTHVTLGCDYEDARGFQNSGAAAVFRYDATASTWNQLGYQMEGVANNDRFGISTAISANGDVFGASTAQWDGFDLTSYRTMADSGGVFIFRLVRPACSELDCSTLKGNGWATNPANANTKCSSPECTSTEVDLCCIRSGSPTPPPTTNPTPTNPTAEATVRYSASVTLTSDHSQPPICESGAGRQAYLNAVAAVAEVPSNKVVFVRCDYSRRYTSATIIADITQDSPALAKQAADKLVADGASAALATQTNTALDAAGITNKIGTISSSSTVIRCTNATECESSGLDWQLVLTIVGAVLVATVVCGTVAVIVRRRRRAMQPNTPGIDMQKGNAGTAADTTMFEMACRESDTTTDMQKGDADPSSSSIPVYVDDGQQV